MQGPGLKLPPGRDLSKWSCILITHLGIVRHTYELSAADFVGRSVVFVRDDPYPFCCLAEPSTY